jgi:RNA polymerase sigma-70 factor (ECF subfamily)
MKQLQEVSAGNNNFFGSPNKKMTMDQKKEAEIIVRILRGDRQAYSLLVEEYKTPVYNLAYRMTGSYEDADDLTQETFLRAYRKIRYFDPQKRFFTWLYTIGLNLIRNHLKKRMRENQHKTAKYAFPDVKGEDNNESEDSPVSGDDIARLEKSLQNIPVDSREAIILRFYSGLSFEEIAAVSDASLSAVKMRVYRGLERLKQLMSR